VSDADALERLRDHYQRVVDEKFESAIPRDFRIVFNPQLRRLTGRITYRARLIEISRWHFLQYGLEDALATLEHELLHLYLHTKRLPSGHGAEFKARARALGIRVFHTNEYPRNAPTPYRWIYECPSCARMVSRVRRSNARLACGPCCRAQNGGRWAACYELKLSGKVRMV
jgi:predicted SprT family Zn-dependent metalloprotease